MLAFDNPNFVTKIQKCPSFSECFAGYKFYYLLLQLILIPVASLLSHNLSRAAFAYRKKGEFHLLSYWDYYNDCEYMCV